MTVKIMRTAPDHHMRALELLKDRARARTPSNRAGRKTAIAGVRRRWTAKMMPEPRKRTSSKSVSSLAEQIAVPKKGPRHSLPRKRSNAPRTGRKPGDARRTKRGRGSANVSGKGNVSARRRLQSCARSRSP
jgi:hypothetical protein